VQCAVDGLAQNVEKLCFSTKICVFFTAMHQAFATGKLCLWHNKILKMRDFHLKTVVFTSLFGGYFLTGWELEAESQIHVFCTRLRLAHLSHFAVKFLSMRRFLAEKSCAK
jgi:hypothetical protein